MPTCADDPPSHELHWVAEMVDHRLVGRLGAGEGRAQPLPVLGGYLEPDILADQETRRRCL